MSHPLPATLSTPTRTNMYSKAKLTYHHRPHSIHKTSQQKTSESATTGPPPPQHIFHDALPNNAYRQPLTPSLTETQSKYLGTMCSLMSPSSPALSHPAALVLLNFAHKGSPAKTSNGWSLDLLNEVIRHGAYPSASNLVAAAEALISETMLKVKAMIDPRSILPRIMHALAITAVDSTPFLFAKLDVKDSFGKWLSPKTTSTTLLMSSPNCPAKKPLAPNHRPLLSP